MKTLLILSIAGGCSSRTPSSIGIDQSGLKDCPNSPNCVSTEARDEKHRTEPFQIKGAPEAGWTAIVNSVAGMPRTKIITTTDNYLHAECRSRIFRFVDDLELYLDRSNGRISVRSASRSGYSDFGVNRKRVETLRQKLQSENLIE
jgi:uncharacterized protein (DUF1499 family)